MTSKMVVHGIPGSPYVRAALLTLEEKGADYEFAAMAPGALKQHPHLSRHPFGRIPAFEHDGWMLYETQAIMRYVDVVVPGPRLQPEEPRAAARMNQLMGITDCMSCRRSRRRSPAIASSRRTSIGRSMRTRLSRLSPTRRCASPRSDGCSMVMPGWRGTRSASPICCSRHISRCSRWRRKAWLYCRTTRT